MMGRREVNDTATALSAVASGHTLCLAELANGSPSYTQVAKVDVRVVRCQPGMACTVCYCRWRAVVSAHPAERAQAGCMTYSHA